MKGNEVVGEQLINLADMVDVISSASAALHYFNMCARRDKSMIIHQVPIDSAGNSNRHGEERSGFERQIMQSVNTKSISSFDFQWRRRRHTYAFVWRKLISCDWQFCLLCTRACFCLSIRLMTTSKCVCSFISLVCAARLFRLSRNAHFPCDIKFAWKKWSGKLLVRKGPSPHQSLHWCARDANVGAARSIFAKSYLTFLSAPISESYFLRCFRSVNSRQNAFAVQEFF